MVLPQDVRIGNKVWWRKEEEIHYTINMMDFHSLDVFSKIEPIVLTKEILEKCGFEYKSGTYNRWFQKMLSGGVGSTMKIYIHDEKRYVFAPHEWNYQHEIKSLHQLQNLYYSLTGKELNVEL